MLNTTKLYDIFHIVNGEHGDPHTILGMHEVEKDGKKVVAVRAFLPGAAAISVIDFANKRKKWPMELVHKGSVISWNIQTTQGTHGETMTLIPSSLRSPIWTDICSVLVPIMKFMKKWAAD